MSQLQSLWEQVFEQAYTLYKMGNLSASIKKALFAWRLSFKTYGEDSAQHCKTLVLIILLYEKMGNFKDAIEVCAQLKKIYEKTLGIESEQTQKISQKYNELLGRAGLSETNKVIPVPSNEYNQTESIRVQHIEEQSMEGYIHSHDYMYCHNCGANVLKKAYACPCCGVKPEINIKIGDNKQQEPQTNTESIVGFVCGILSLLFAAIIFGPLAIIFSSIGLSKKQKKQALGYIGLFLGICATLYVVYVISSCTQELERIQRQYSQY